LGGTTGCETGGDTDRSRTRLLRYGFLTKRWGRGRSAGHRRSSGRAADLVDDLTYLLLTDSLADLF
jgi:hypothetical protein